jgi:hypothetical protein
LPCAPHPKTRILGYKQREEEDFPYPTFFYFFNQQTIQPPKSKSNPKQVIQNSNQAMEEEDLSFPTFFFLQSANNSTPKKQKHPKASFSKCNCNSSSSITQKKLCTFPSNIQIPRQIIHYPTLKTL